MTLDAISEVARAKRVLSKMSETGAIDADLAAVAADTLIEKATTIPKMMRERSIELPKTCPKRRDAFLAHASAMEMAARSIQAAGTNTQAFDTAFKALCGASRVGASQPQ